MVATTSDILVLGATGFTGRLITRYLSTHPQRSSFTFTLAARSKSKLDALITDLSLKASATLPPDNTSVGVLKVDVTNFDEVEAAVRTVKVVINTVGPYWRWGTPVVRACVRHGIHYVDLTGETAWIRDIIAEFDYPATKTGAIIVPSCGMDSVPSDLSVFLSNKTLKSLSPPLDITTSTTAFAFRGGISGGSLASAMVYIEEIPRDKIKEASKDYSLSPMKGLPSTSLKLLYKLPHCTPKIFGAFFVMQPTNKALVQRTWGLLQTNYGKSAPRYGSHFQYDEFMICSNAVISVLFSLGLALGGLCLLFPPVRWLIKRYAPQPGEGPGEEVQQNGYFKATNISTSAASPSNPVPVHVKSVIKGNGDPGYFLTSIMITESALSLLAPGQLPALAQKGGVLTPVTAFGDVLIERLRETGRFAFESGVAKEGKWEGKKDV